MKILFYDTKSYDRESFEAVVKNFPEISIEYTKSDLDPRTAALAEGFDAVCAFVSSDIGTRTMEILHARNVRLILMRCAGFNNVDLDTAENMTFVSCVSRATPRKRWRSMPWPWRWPATAVCTRLTIRYGKMISA